MQKGTRAGRKKKRGLGWKIMMGVLAMVFMAAAGAGVYAYLIYNDAKATVNQQIHEPVASMDTALAKKKIEEAEEPLNFLLLGVDEREDDSGRSDALMVLSLDPENDSMQLISIPRDTRTEIIGKGIEDKINHAYAFGGTEMSISTVENLLDIELDYYITMNMEGLTEMVDAVGGITVQNELDWVDKGYYEKGFHYKKGELQLNGAETMGFVRMRYQDPDGDFGRTKRQRKVIEGIVEKGASVASVNKVDDMIEVLGNNMKTNMDFEDMQNILKNYSDTRKNFVSYQMTGTGTYITNSSGQDIYYLIVTDEEVAKVHDMISSIKSS